jgi:hypothetical protein
MDSSGGTVPGVRRRFRHRPTQRRGGRGGRTPTAPHVRPAGTVIVGVSAHRSTRPAALDGSVARPVRQDLRCRFSVAIPLLAALVLVNQQEAFRRRATTSVLAVIARVVAQNCAFVGVVAGFWHIHWIAGVGMLASGLVAVVVHSAGYTRLERDQEPTPQEGDEPGDTQS